MNGADQTTRPAELPPGRAPSPPPNLPPLPPQHARPPRLPRRPDPAPAQLLWVSVAAGLVVQAGLPGGVTNLAVSGGLAIVLIGLLTKQRLSQRSARAAAAAALAPVAMLAWWSSPWLAASNLAAAGVLVGAALAFARNGSMSDTTLWRGLGRLADTVPDAVRAPAALRPLLPEPDPSRRTNIGRVAGALLVCVPILAIVVALLANADPVFASLITPEVSLGWLGSHLMWATVAALGSLAVIGAAGAETRSRSPKGRFGRLEVVTMLGLTAAVLAAFVGSQAFAATAAGEQRILEAGLTPAEYARSGFFQLCWATAAIVSLLAGIRALAAPGVMTTTAVRALGALVPVLALGLVAVSLRRMAVYDDAFGLTMLRLWVVGGAVWLGVVLILIAVRNAGVGDGRDWVLAGAVLSALALVAVADVTNPEAFVVRHNVARAERGAPVDVDYLAQLSSDAQPALVAAVVDEGDDGRLDLDAAIDCDDAAAGVSSLNRSEHAARVAQSEACADTPSG